MKGHRFKANSLNIKHDFEFNGCCERLRLGDNMFQLTDINRIHMDLGEEPFQIPLHAYLKPSKGLQFITLMNRTKKPHMFVELYGKPTKKFKTSGATIK